MRLAYNLNRAFPDIAFRNIFQPPALMLDVLNLEFQQRGQFAGEHPVTLLVAVLHGLYRFVVGHFTDDKGHFLQSSQLTAVGTAMARYNFIAVSIFLRAGKTGNHYTVYADRSNDFLYLRIVPYLKGVRTECVKRMNLGKFQINQLAFLNRAGRCSRLGSRLFHSSSFLQCRILCGLNGLLGIRGLSIASGHFVSFGRLGLVRGRLIRLWWAALRAQPISPISDFQSQPFPLSADGHGAAFSVPPYWRAAVFLRGCRLWRFGGSDFSTSARAFCLFSAISSLILSKDTTTSPDSGMAGPVCSCWGSDAAACSGVAIGSAASGEIFSAGPVFNFYRPFTILLFVKVAQI